MIALVKGSDLEKEVDNFSKEILLAGMLVKEEKDISPFISNRMTTSADEVVHTFLKEVSKQPCEAVLSAVGTYDRAARSRTRMGFNSMASALEIPPPKGIVPLVSVAMKDFRLVEAPKSSRRTSHEARNSLEALSAIIKDSGAFVSYLQNTGKLAGQILSSTSATASMQARLIPGLAAGSLLPDVSGVVPVTLVTQALIRKLRNFFSS